MADEYLVQGGTGAASGAAMGAMLGGPMGAAIGGTAGLGIGLLGASSSRKAKKAQAAAIRAQEEAQEREFGRRAKGAGAARMAFGDVWSMGNEAAPGMSWGRGRHTGISFDPAKHMDRAKTVTRHGELAGAIESEALATRDAGQANLANAAQQARVAQRAVSGQRGLLGSSLDRSARQALLGQYVGNRANLAAATEGSREAGWGALRSRQMNLENLALGGANIGSQLGALKTASTIAGARAQMPYAAFGNLLNTGMGVIDSGMRAEAQGGMGLTALGLPPLGVGPRGKTNAPTGASVSGG